jgi:hypothetical protein
MPLLPSGWAALHKPYVGFEGYKHSCSTILLFISMPGGINAFRRSLSLKRLV